MDRRMELLDRIAEFNLNTIDYPRVAKLEFGNYLLNVKVWRGVFDPQFAFTSKYLIKTIIEKGYKFECAFDMGCGCGAIAIAMIENKIAERVHAYDIQPLACRNAKLNVRKNLEACDRVKVLRRNLFLHLGYHYVPEAVSPEFDGGVFNQPYLPQSRAQNKWQESGAIGGNVLIRNFLEQAKRFVFSGSPIIMPFSDVVGEEHNPASIALDLGFTVKQISKYKDNNGIHRIFEMIY